MNIEQIRDYCLKLGPVTESFPFDDTTLVFKVHNKMFALIILKGPIRINLKCDPEYAITLREEYDFVIPGYHMNKKHWNTLCDIETIPSNLIEQWIKDSYQLVWNSLPKKTRLISENKKV
ncbi:MAG: MmcQ/YjbR family DNA-binding protein [Prolixibacteraceae bacterium]